MARKAKHSVSRKRKHTHKRKTHRHRRVHRKGGADMLSGAPLKYHLAGDWSSKMSMGQGGDYLKYHQGQHGGYLAGSPFPGSVTDSMLPANLREAAHIGGLDKAIADSALLTDQAGGRRRTKRSHRHRKGSKKQRSQRKRSQRKRSQRRSQRKRGGNLGYAPFPSSGMLLRSPADYSRAGLNPSYITGGVEAEQARAREAM